MPTAAPDIRPAPARPPRLRRPWADPSALRLAADAVVVLAGAWWLLGQLAAVLRPLLLAVFLGYVLLPYYTRLRRRLPAPVAVALVVGATTAGLMALAVAVVGSLTALQSKEEKADLKARTEAAFTAGKGWARGHLPGDWVKKYLPAEDGGPGEARPERVAAEWLTEEGLKLANVAALGLLEAATAGLYLLFLLMESTRFPDRVRAAYAPDRAAEVLHMFGRINAAIVSYLKAKVLSSLLLAAPVGVVLAACGVRFPLLWAVLTFVCNFIPYAGSVVAYSLPVLFGFLQLDAGWRPALAAGLLLACHLGTAAVIEPLLIGKAVGLSPLVILAALSVWGLLWGLPGMFLAVPLTVGLVLVLDNLPVTRPLAKLLSG